MLVVTDISVVSIFSFNSRQESEFSKSEHNNQCIITSNPISDVQNIYKNSQYVQYKQTSIISHSNT